MRPALAAMQERPLDVLVAGGGIAGAAAAREAALRGLRVGLVEAQDFGAGTSGATTRLAHGGLRYLEQLDFAQVREGLRERRWLLHAAPHLVQPLPFLFPLPKGRPLLRAGVRLAVGLYDVLGGRDLPRARRLREREARALEPRLREGFAGALAFHDAQVLHPERLVLEFALDAQAHGAAVANHARVAALGRSGKGWAAQVHDEVEDASAEVRARVVLNCAGPWVGRLAGLAGVQRPLTRATRGSHVAFPNMLQRALVLRARDGRTFFALPWNEVTLVGTTDLDEPRDPEQVEASREEVAYLLREAGAFVELPLQPSYTTCGVRAMLRVEGVAPGKVPRGHAIVDHARDGALGLLSVVGGKLTTARAVAQDAVDAACKELGAPRPRATAALLPGGEGFAAVRTLLDRAGLAPGLARSLRLLGAHAPSALVEGPRVCERHATRGMVHRAVREELCVTLGDLMLRRTLAGHAPDLGAHCVERMAEAMGEFRGWDASEREAQLRAYEAEVARRRGGLA